MNKTTMTNASRRDFLCTAAASTAGVMAFGAGLMPAWRASARQSEAPAKKSLLILGGTGFLGPAIIEAAKARGHRVTIFNRGVTEKRKGIAIDGVEKLVGDRDPNKGEGLKALEGKKFDVVFDDCGYVPRIVKASAELLAPNVAQYVYISSISAYKDNSKAGSDESADVAVMADPTIESMGDSFENYGPLKALCEAAAEKAMPGRVANVRPGFIVGPGDPTDRFTYWPVRIAKGGEVLVPGTPDDPVQFIDVRDLAAWLVHLAETNTTGLFNATGPDKPLNMRAFVEACKTVSKSDATFTWADVKFLSENQVGDGGFPIWVPAEGETAGFHTWKIDRALKAGLTFRPLAQTIADTLAWYPLELKRREEATKRLIAEAEEKKQPAPNVPDWSKLRAGIAMEDEAKLLAAWHKAKEGAKEKAGEKAG